MITSNKRVDKMKSNDNIAQLEAFLASVMVELQRSDLADCLAVWEAGSDEWEEGAMILFREELLKPLSQAVDSIRRYKQIEDYIELIPFIKEQEMVKRSEVFETRKIALNLSIMSRVLRIGDRSNSRTTHRRRSMRCF